jgi:hypothetical protein
VTNAKSNKKHAKELARRKKLAARQRWLRELKRKHEFPRLVVEPNGAEPRFVELVQAAVETIDFRDESEFFEEAREFFRMCKQFGGELAVESFLQAGEQVGEGGRDFLVDVVAHLGDALLRRIPAASLKPWIPFNSVQFVASGNCIRARPCGLQRAKGQGGTVYYSRHEPTVEVGGRELVVAFSGHAIEQTGPRLTCDWPCYNAVVDAFTLFDETVEFEVCELDRGQLAFTFFETCRLGTVGQYLSQEILGDRFDPNRQYSLRVGYCPAVVDGRFLKAKTILFPGYASTPEFDALLRADLPSERRREMLEDAQALNLSRLVEDGAHLLRWYHENGVEQVRAGWAAEWGIHHPQAI